jgi:hypothetical protein
MERFSIGRSLIIELTYDQVLSCCSPSQCITIIQICPVVKRNLARGDDGMKEWEDRERERESSKRVLGHKLFPKMTTRHQA